MANPGYSRKECQAALDCVAEHHGNKSAAARSMGKKVRTFYDIIESAQTKFNLVPNVKPIKPRIRVPARSIYQPTPDESGKPVKVFVWGCAHDTPSIPDKSRFANAGKLLSEIGADYCIDLGDSLDLGSLSFHAKPGSMDDRERPFFKAEIASLEESQAAFDKYAPSNEEIPRTHLHGNHEYRAKRFEDANPASQGVFTTELDQVFARFNWTIMQYREWAYIDGVGFTHAPINGMGKEIAGMNADATVAREATHSVVWSHTHKQALIPKPKIGIGNRISVFNTGSFMPNGYIKKYAGLSMTGWTYGLHQLTLRNGDIESVKTWSELELQEKFA